jgi:hypothetical protein
VLVVATALLVTASAVWWIQRDDYKPVTYGGIRLEVPSSWPVLRDQRNVYSCEWQIVGKLYLNPEHVEPSLCPAFAYVGKGSNAASDERVSFLLLIVLWTVIIMSCSP